MDTRATESRALPPQLPSSPEARLMEVAVIRCSAPQIRPDLPANLSSLRVGDRKKLFRQRERSRDTIFREVQGQAGFLRRSASGSAAEKSGLESIAQFLSFGETVSIEVRWSLTGEGSDGGHKSRRDPPVHRRRC
jgi:hypothetical protein